MFIVIATRSPASISISIEICENLRNDLSNPDGDNETGGGRGGEGDMEC